MDKKTIEVYDKNATHYANDWMSQATPLEIYDIVKRFFIPGAPTADIGCGSGRDCGWLSDQAFPVTGYDASKGLLKIAKKNFPLLEFRYATLPYLAEIKDAAYTNVLCETVLQHLPTNEHLPSLENLLRITKAEGVLSLSFRHPQQSRGNREKDERLYVPIDCAAFKELAENLGFKTLHHESTTSSSSLKKITQLVFKRA